MKFFLNDKSESYLRNLESEFGDSTNGIRQELNKFENAGLLSSHLKGNKKLFRANTAHPLFPEIHSLLIKHIGFDRIIDEVVANVGELSHVYLVGDFAKGMDSNIIDLVFVGNDINKNYLLKLVGKAERIIRRKIRYLLLACDELQSFLSNKKETEFLLLWENQQ